jgi:hypothetical protein
MDSVPLEPEELVLWYQWLVILAIWNIILELEVNWVGSEKIWDEFGQFTMG